MTSPDGLEGSGAFGARVQRVQRVQRVAVGAFWKYKGASLYKTFTTGLSPVGKPYNRPAGEEMHPFWWLAPPPSPRRGDFILRYALSEGIALQSFILPPEQGEVRRSRIGGSPAAANHQNANQAL